MVTLEIITVEEIITEEMIEFLNLMLIVQNLIIHLTMRLFREKMPVETIIMHQNWWRSIMI